MNKAADIPGVVLHRLTEHGDPRGVLREIYRDDWVAPDRFRQWNLVRSEAHALRGVHVHHGHYDYLHVIDGEMLLGLHDLRPEDPADRRSAFVTLTGDDPLAVEIPVGVCHGFCFPVKTTYVYGLSKPWSITEKLGCRYDARELGLDWPVADPILSPVDEAPEHTYETMRAAWLAGPRGRD
jgi:dTDP-4-dehydrorhamnose 3,5-epimerase